MLTIDPVSATPPFEQLRAQLAAQIRQGELAGGARLPTVRGLADELGLAANTVARAYRELESSGLVEPRGRNGTVVSWSGEAAEQQLQQAAAAFADQARVLGVDPDRALQLVSSALQR